MRDFTRWQRSPVGAGRSRIATAVTAPTTAVDDSVAVLLRAAFANARDCGARPTNGESGGVAHVPLELMFGPGARLQCETAALLDGGVGGVSARLIVNR